jgi:hypothetical protein
MTDPLLEEVYQAREKLWQRGGKTLRGVGEYLRECGRRAKERGVLWIESEEEREAIAAEVRARLAKEELDGALCVREEREEYCRAKARGGRGSATKGTKKAHGEKGKGARGVAEGRRGESAKGQKGEKKGQGKTACQSNHQTTKPPNHQTGRKISGRKGAPAQSEVMR